MKQRLINKKIIKENELNIYLDGFKSQDLIKKVEALIEHQKVSWSLLRENIKFLNNSKLKIINFGNYNITIQCNRRRSKSTFAKIDREYIEKRKCFLCMENLPPEEKGFIWNKEYIILCNPYPILPGHIVVSNIRHIPQTICSNFKDMLGLSRELKDRMVVIYNGPECGASAPDHQHFQAFYKEYFVMGKDWHNLKKKNRCVERILDEKVVKIDFIRKYLRKVLVLQGENKKVLNKWFKKIFNILKEFYPGAVEPYLNLAVFYNDNRYVVFVILRDKHRPDYFYLEDPDRISVSPAVIDFSGVLIVPEKLHFENINKDKVIDIFKQTTMADSRFKKFYSKLKNAI